MDAVNYKTYLDILHSELIPAMGCTEPIAVALAVAKAVETLEENHVSGWRLSGEYSLKAEVSGNILKNGMEWAYREQEW